MKGLGGMRAVDQKGKLQSRSLSTVGGSGQATASEDRPSAHQFQPTGPRHPNEDKAIRYQAPKPGNHEHSLQELELH